MNVMGDGALNHSAYCQMQTSFTGQFNRNVCVCVLRSNNSEDHESSIFRRCEQHGYQLKDGVQFHLYISTSPCGDARIFSPHEAAVEGLNASLHTTTIHFIHMIVTYRVNQCWFINTRKARTVYSRLV